MCGFMNQNSFTPMNSILDVDRTYEVFFNEILTSYEVEKLLSVMGFTGTNTKVEK